MPLDIRVPIGLMMGLMGILLAGYGLLGPRDIYARSLGINVNLWWGVVMLVFGAVMIFLGRRGTSAMRSAEARAEGRLIEELEHEAGKEHERRPH